MDKFIKSVFLYTIYAALGYCILLTLIGLIVPDKYLPNLKYRLGAIGFTYSRLAEVKEVKDRDVLFLGSSHAYRGFDTRMYTDLGYKVFNLGSSTQTPLQTKVLLQRYLDLLNPKLVIFEVYPLIFCSDGVESALDIISNDRNDLFSLEMARELDHALIYNSLLYGSIRDLIGLNASFSEKKWRAISTYIPGGYVHRKLRHFDYIDYPKDHWDFQESQFKYFEEILTMLEQRNIEVKLVYAPITKSKYQSYDNHKAFDLKMKEYGFYYNLNETLNLDDSLHFYDSDHLNSIGVKIFNEKILEILKEYPMNKQ